MNSIKDKLIKSLAKAGKHNSNIMTPPKVVLWLDPEKQWESIIKLLKNDLPQLLVLGEYQPGEKQGPPIWLKCMVDRTLPDADWSQDAIPIIYLPGISKRELKNVEEVPLGLQPIVEYQYTGTLWLHENGKEWTVAAFIQNPEGMNVKVAQDGGTKEAIQSSLTEIFNADNVFYGKRFVDADFLLNQQYPNIGVDILKWMEQGDNFLKSLPSSKQQTFRTICKNNYQFEPDVKNIKDITYQLGCRKTPWTQIWEYFSHAPARYPNVQKYLRLAKPDDLGIGMFEIPRDSWPQENEEAENALRMALGKLPSLSMAEAQKRLGALISEHKWRHDSVWAELGEAPLLSALEHLHKLSLLVTKTYPSRAVNEILTYYKKDGYKVDEAMIDALAAVQGMSDTSVIKVCIEYLYKPWLETITEKFQQHFDTSVLQEIAPLDTEVVLFVDALRFDISKRLEERLRNLGTVESTCHLTAIPTLTPTAKPYNSPLRDEIDKKSNINEFRPTISGKDLTTQIFRNYLTEVEYNYAKHPHEIEEGKKYWLEIGTLDTKGHEEQSGMVKRIPELLDEVVDTLLRVREMGIKNVTIVTDHGWLLMPGGLPKATLTKDLSETRWGRCAIIKQGAKVDFPQHPWTWNNEVYIAYAPGISFFKANEEYAHGGISIQECLVPRVDIQFESAAVLSGKISKVSWNQLICHVELSDALDGYIVDIRRKKEDESTSVVLSKPDRRVVSSNKAKLMIDSSYEKDAAHLVLMTKEKIILDSKLITVGG